MKWLSDHRLRPALWGFFISIVIVGILSVLRWIWPMTIERSWDDVRLNVEESNRQRVEKMFRERLNALFQRAVDVADNDSLLQMLVSNDPASVRDGFAGLDRMRDDLNVTIDIMDPRGTIISWAGRRVFDSIPADVEVSSLDTIVFTTETSLHSFLSVGIRTAKGGLFAVVSSPLELNYPISNRFLARVSFSEELASELGRDVELVMSAEDLTSGQTGATRIVLRDYRAAPVAVALLSPVTMESYIVSLQLQLEYYLTLALGAGSILLVLIFWRGLAIVTQLWLRIVFLSFLLWSVRYLWVVLGFPADLIGGHFFDSFLFGTPFGGGLSSSPGETLISVFTLFLNVAFIVSLVNRRSSSGRSALSDKTFHRIVAVATVLGSFVALMLLTRGFGAIHRSFVFDSAIRYYESSSIIPDAITSMMLVCTVLVSISLLLVYCLVISGLTDLFGRQLKGGRNRRKIRVFFFLSYSVLSSVIFALLPGLSIPFFFPSFVCAIALLILAIHEWQQTKRRAAFAWTIPQVGVIILGSFVISVPLLDGHIHEKERDNMIMVAREVVRPAGSWLPFVLTEGLQQIIESQIEGTLEDGDGPRQRRNAFRLWAQTLMSVEGYNSAVVLYDTDGNETSRFAVGLTSYEQRELLERIFELDEEIPRTIERRVAGGLIRYYGTWGTLRDRSGTVTGYVAVMLSASQQSLFRGEAPSVLRAVGAEAFGESRSTMVADYEDGILVSSNSPALVSGSILGSDIEQTLEEVPGDAVFGTIRLDDETFELVYLKDLNIRERVVAVGLAQRGFRWHLFYIVKILLIYVVLGGLFLLVWMIALWKHLRFTSFGFRAKLVSAFLILSFIPMVFLAYYNREFAVERINASVEASLREDLNLLQRRIEVLVRDEEDFVQGVDDDFCDAIADELAIDFSVFRHSELLASSRPELYGASILDDRLNGTAFASVVLQGRPFFTSMQQVGDVRYAVGYSPVAIGDRFVGVLSVPTLYKQADIEAELAERNAFMISIYAVILGLVIVLGVATANTLSRPLRELTEASRRVGRGKLDVSLNRRSSDEIGELFDSFNEMVRELSRNREELSRAEREAAWREMAKQVAHEIKNPLTPMKLSLQHLRQAFRDKAKNLDHIVETVSKTVMEQVDTLARIATEFSNFARMPDRRFERVDVHQVLKESISLFDHVSGVRLHTKYGSGTPIVIADREELRRVFVNILRNGIQAMDEKGDIHVTSVITEHKCTLTFSDTGSGIPQAVLEKVFEPNFSTKSDGMGLGLAISQRTIQDLDGTISIHSSVGKGTTVEIVIPLSTSHHE